MTTIEVLPDSVLVKLSLDELYGINNALNEVCNALDGVDFSTRMGLEREVVATLLDQVHALIAETESR